MPAEGSADNFIDWSENKAENVTVAKISGSLLIYIEF
jgi:hypothetical protein